MGAPAPKTPTKWPSRLQRIRWAVNRIVRRAIFAPLPRTWGIRWEMWEDDRTHTSDLAELRARNADRDQQEGVNGLYMDMYQWHVEELEVIHSSQLIQKANRLRVPTPEIPWAKRDDGGNEIWQWSWGNGKWYLTPKGFKEVRAEIRAERDARRSWMNSWVGVLGALASVLAALTGLFAVWLGLGPN